MATGSLLEAQLDEGRKLTDLLARSGFDVAAAAWVRASDDDRWTLYLASRRVDEAGVKDAYRELFEVSPSIPDGWALLSRVKLIGADHPIARDLVEVRNQSPTSFPIHSLRPRLGDLSVEDVYVYPPVEARPGKPCQAFTVTYQRQSGSNRWTATVQRGERYQGFGTTGAVFYTTARWSGENEGDEPFALVSVLLELTSDLDRAEFLPPEIWRLMADQARRAADAMFLTRHPDAVIEPNGDVE